MFISDAVNVVGTTDKYVLKKTDENGTKRCLRLWMGLGWYAYN